MESVCSSNSLLSRYDKKSVPFRSCQIARDLMHRRYNCLDICNTVQDALEWISRTGLCTIPIISTQAGDPQDNRILHGTVTADDLLFNTRTGGPCCSRPELTLDQVVSSRMQIVKADTPLPIVVQKMLEYRVDVFFVSEGKKISGIVSCQDILDDMIGMGMIGNALFTEDRPEFGFQQSIRSFIHSDLIRLPSGTTVKNAMTAMLESGLPCVSVIDDADSFCGLLSRQNFLDFFRKWNLSHETTNKPSLSDILSMPVDQLIQKSGPRINENNTLLDTLQNMRFNTIPSMAVFSDSGDYLGFVSVCVLLSAYLA